jgi:hypothetical protein
VPMNRIGIYGSTGYLGKCLLENLFSSTGIPRLEFVSYPIIIDCSFPSQESEKVILIEYLDLIQKRAQFYSLNSIKYVYLGSYSSIDPVISSYGKIKLLAENLVIENGGIVIKLGLVVNPSVPGGRFKELVSVLKKFESLPLPSEESFELYVQEESKFIDELGESDRFESGKIYLLESVEKSSLSALIRKTFPGHRYYLINSFVSNWIERILRICPSSSFLDPLKSLAVKRRIDSKLYCVLPNNEKGGD